MFAVSEQRVPKRMDIPGSQHDVSVSIWLEDTSTKGSRRFMITGKRRYEAPITAPR